VGFTDKHFLNIRNKHGNKINYGLKIKPLAATSQTIGANFIKNNYPVVPTRPFLMGRAKNYRC